MGTLSALYGVADIAIVCGSFMPIGGHNLLEPAVHGIPVIYGEYMNKQKEILHLFEVSEGGIQVTAQELKSTLISLMNDKRKRAKYGELAQKAVEANRGSAKRCVEVLKEHANF